MEIILSLTSQLSLLVMAGILFGICLLMSIFAACTPHEEIEKQRRRIRWRRYLKIGMASAGLLLLVWTAVWYAKEQRRNLDSEQRTLDNQTFKMKCDIDKALSASLDELRVCADWDHCKEIQDRIGQSYSELSPEFVNELAMETSFDTFSAVDEQGIECKQDASTEDLSEIDFVKEGLDGKGGINILHYENDGTQVFNFYLPIFSYDTGTEKVEAIVRGEYSVENFLQPYLSPLGSYSSWETDTFFCEGDGTMLTGSGDYLYEGELAQALFRYGRIDQEMKEEVDRVFNGLDSSSVIVKDQKDTIDGICAVRLDSCDCVLVSLLHKSGKSLRQSLSIAVYYVVLGGFYIAAAILFGGLAKRQEQRREEAELRQW